MKNKQILEACCGPRLFWFDKQQPNTIFIDNRKRAKGYNQNRPNREINPDIIMDFRDLKFPDKKFKLVVFDPPHIFAKGETFRLVKDYGYLNKSTWANDIKKGFEECWRVLEDYGVLIFKWNESGIKKKDVLKLFHTSPLFGHPVRSKIPTSWFCFMKIPKEN